MNLITKAIALVGLQPLAKACGVSYQSVRKWEANGRLPRTEWTGETDHARAIEIATGGKVSRKQLLASRKGAIAA
jgi:DNA-binding transcriptional regulator YdaS (Cro superfamily)